MVNVLELHRVIAYLLLFCALLTHAITRPERGAATIRYIKDVTTADESCEQSRDLIEFIYFERVRSDYVAYGPRTRFRIRLPNDPIVYAIDGQAIRSEERQSGRTAPQSGTRSVKVPQRTSYCQHRCADTRPMLNGNREDFLPSVELIEDNVQDKSRSPSGPAIVRATEYVPTHEVKYRSLYRFVCKPGYIAEVVYLSWFMMSTPPEGPRRESCECILDAEVEVTQEPGMIRGHQTECYDSAIATGLGNVAAWFSEKMQLDGSVNIDYEHVGPSRKPYQARPLVDDFHLFLIIRAVN